MHGIEPALQDLLQAHIVVLLTHRGLLRSGVLMVPASGMVGDGHVRLWRLSGLLILRLLDAHLLTEVVHLGENHLAHFADILDHLEVEVEGRGARRLIGRIMPDVQVWMLESGLDADARRGIERQHLVEQVEGVGIRIGEQAREGHFSHEREIADIVLRTG